VFVGAFPLKLRPYVSSKEIEFHPWQQMYSYPQKLHDLEIQMCVAPLQDNNFNKAKSDLKYIEACAFGLPIACQDIDTYKNAPIKFNSGEEMIARVRETLKDSQKYKNNSRKWYQVAQERFLENDKNLDCFLELFRLGYGDPGRVQLGKYNTDI
ncbi:MAG: glycosyltransferase, partial [Minisyncoccia bacterium]